MAIILVEQYFDFARELADRFAVMERGAIVMSGGQAELQSPCLPARLSLAFLIPPMYGPREAFADGSSAPEARHDLSIITKLAGSASIPSSGLECEAVVLNSAGGMAGGDLARLSFDAGRKSRVRVTTQSAEKIYRTDEQPVRISTDIKIGDAAQFAWIPQETILFDGSRLERTLTVEVAESATAILIEMTVFGRVARGERLRSGAIIDRWRVRRDDALVFADDIRMSGDISAITGKTSTGNGATAIATILCVSPKAEKYLQSVRAVLAGSSVDCGASAWNGLLVARFAGRDPFAVRVAVAQALRRLSRRELPRVWSI